MGEPGEAEEEEAQHVGRGEEEKAQHVGRGEEEPQPTSEYFIYCS